MSIEASFHVQELNPLDMNLCYSMMTEATVKKIMARYFQSNKVNAIPTAGAGPDFLVEGKAIEVKGSDADFNKAVDQYCDYLLTGRFSGLAISFPIDLVSVPANLLKVATLGRIAWETTSRYVGVYLVTTDLKNFYYLRYLPYSDQLLNEIMDRISSRSKRTISDSANLAKEAKDDLRWISTTILEALHEYVTEKPDLTVGMDVIQAHED
jgi:hypothetical protein